MRGSRKVWLILALVAVSFVLRREIVGLVRVVPILFDAAPTVLPVPVEGVSPRELEDTWGAARSGGRKHEGIDIFVPRGTRVVSVSPGLVTGHGWNTLGGRFVRVTGPGGVQFYYAHLDAFAEPRIANWVERGEVLGFVGNTGNARTTPPHLHFGVYDFWGEARNPYPLLVALEPMDLPRVKSETQRR